MAPPLGVFPPLTKFLRGPYRGYILGIASMMLLVGVRQLFLDSLFGTMLPQRLFVLPAIAAAWSGGLLPGLFITLLGAIAAPLCFGEHSLSAIDWPMTLTFVMVGVVMSGFMESLHRARRRLEDRQQRLEHEIVERRKAEAAERDQRDLLTREVEQRKLAQMALHEQEERMRMAIESAHIGTWDLNVLTGERKWSDRSKEMFGVAPEDDVSTLSFVELIHVDDRARVQRAITRALDPQGDGRYQTDYRIVLRDGTIRWIVAMGKAFFQGEGATRKAVRFIGTVFDFSERKALEQALQEADRRKDEFLATLAHELRNPLAPMSYALQLWPSIDRNSDEADELVAMMSRQIGQITRLIDDLLDVSRITRGKIELRKQPADICTILNSSIESVQSFVESCGHRLTVTLPSETVMVEADVARLVQVFANILNNAAKFTASNGVIQLSVSSTGDRVEVRIRDNGPGIPAHLLKDIFEMFHQVDGTISRSSGGLGIGLTLVKQLVEMHGGTVEACSDGPGHGSEFVVCLPTHIPASEAIRADGPHFRIRPIHVLPRHRILVVDDVVASAETLAIMLGRMGQTVSTLHDGASAINWVLANKPDCVFLDIAMPLMDGYEVARRLRTHVELADMVLIALTGYGQEEDRRQAFDAGFNHHMVKPASIDALEQVLHTVPLGKQAAEHH